MKSRVMAMDKDFRSSLINDGITATSERFGMTCEQARYIATRHMINYKRVWRGKKPNPERDNEIVRLRKEGWTLQKIGDKFNLTRERVRQIMEEK